MLSQKDIPKGDYCYTILGKETIDGKIFIKKRPCPFFERLPMEKDGYTPAYCSFLKEKDPVLLDDRCKICGINMEDEDGIF